MANTEVEGLFFKIGAIFDESFRNIGSTMNQSLSQISGALTGAGASLTAAFTVPIAGAGAAALKMGADMMAAKMGFETMLGSAEKATKFLGDLQNFAAKTPFEFPGLRDAATKMMALGISADQVLPTLRVVGDQVAAMGRSGGEASLSIDRITLALGQMGAKGKVSAQEMNQLAEQGIGAWEALAKHIGVSVPEAMKLAEDGAISAAEGIPAILAGMAEKTGGMMDKLSDTVIGRFSNLKDSVSISLTKLGEALLPFAEIAVGVFEKLAVLLEGAVKWFTELSKPMQLAVVALAGMAAAAGPLLLALGAISAAIVSISSAVSILAGPAVLAGAVVAMKALAIAAAAAAAAFAVWKIGEWLYSFGPVKATVNAIVDAIGSLLSWIAKLPGVSNLITGMNAAWNAAKGAIDSTVSSVLSSGKAFQAQGPTLDQLGAKAKAVIPHFSGLGGAADSAAKATANAAAQMEKQLSSAWKTMSGWLMDLPKTFQQAAQMISSGFNIDGAIRKVTDEMQRLQIEFGEKMPKSAQAMYNALDATRRQLEAFAAVAEQAALAKAFDSATSAVVAYGSQVDRVLKEQAATIAVLNQVSMQGATDAIAKVQQLDGAFRTLGVTWSDTLTVKAQAAAAAFEKVVEAQKRGEVSSIDFLQAQARMLEAQIAAAKQSGASYEALAAQLKGVNAQISTLTGATEKHGAAIKNASGQANQGVSEMAKNWDAFGKQVSTIWTDLGSDIAKSILHAKGFGDAFIKAAEAIKEAFLRHIVEGAIKSMMKGLDGFSGMLGGIGKQITGLFGGLFGGGGGDGLSAPGGGGPGPGSIGGALTGQLTGLVTGITQAITGVINVFQTRRMEQDIGRIEVTSRGQLNQLISLQETFNNWLPYLENADQLQRLEGVEQALYSIAGGQMMRPIGEGLRDGLTNMGGGISQGMQMLINEVGLMRETMRAQMQVLLEISAAIYNAVSKPGFQANFTSGVPQGNGTPGVPNVPTTPAGPQGNGNNVTVNVTSNATNPFAAGQQLAAGMAAGGFR
jgi:tape measure domain-containing protein